MNAAEYEGFYVGLYGAGSGESVDSCIRRTLRMFELLKPIDPTFSQWYAKGWTLKEALQHRLDGNAAEVKRCFEKSTLYPDDKSLAAWNGLNDDEASSVSITWGGTPNPWVCDVNVFDPHELGPVGERLIQLKPMTQLLRALVSAWDPPIGVVISSRHRNLAFDNTDPEDWIGWINYFSHKRGAVPPLPSPVRTEFVEDKGTLVILTPERFSSSNPEHVALSLRVAAELKNAGLLKPLKPPPPPKTL